MVKSANRPMGPKVRLVAVTAKCFQAGDFLPRLDCHPVVMKDYWEWSLAMIGCAWAESGSHRSSGTWKR